MSKVITKIVSKNSSKEKKAVSKGKIITVSKKKSVDTSKSGKK